MNREETARIQVMEACRRLVSAGLVARTWGNISARISENAFVITPSGLAYDRMTPEDLVVVNMEDLSYEGDRKPSSEKGIHCDAYAMHPDVQFVIHTHQEAASVYGIAGKDLEDVSDPDSPDYVPCASYGMPSTDKLRQRVGAAMTRYPKARAILMKYHGALCMGSDPEEAFDVAEKLEARCETFIPGTKPELPVPAAELGKSVRRGTHFQILLHGEKKVYSVKKVPKQAPHQVKIHAAIYRNSKTSFILPVQTSAVVMASEIGITVKPYLDDLAQIAGITVRCVGGWNVNRVAAALKGRNAVLIQGVGALCIGKDPSDVKAVAMILEKGCRAMLHAGIHPEIHPVSGVDARIMRMVYLAKYSKKKDEK